MTLKFGETGDQLGFIDLKVGEALGKSRVSFIAESGRERVVQVIDIEVRPPNPPTTVSQRLNLKPGEQQSISFAPHGMPGSNQTTLEIASVPPLNLAQRLDYLIRYPHGCVEQTTSGAFPQIYLGKLLDLSPEQSRRASDNVQRGIDRLRQFQQGNGSFGYWPGQNEFDSWSTTYVGHFLVEAQRSGHAVPTAMLEDWRKFQQQRARAWLPARRDAALDQAYRLYTLALAGQPELGAMNRLREQSGLPVTASALLAASYKLAGIADVAASLVVGVQAAPENYATEGLTYGSALRDQAILLEASASTGNDAQRQDLVEAISKQLSSETWYSTHSLSWSLLSLAHVVGDAKAKGIDVAWSLDGGKTVIDRSSKPILQLPLSGGNGGPLAIVLKNQSEGVAYITVANRGVANAGTEKAGAESLALDLRFTDGKDNAVDINTLPQGQDFRAHVTVRNTSSVALSNLALTQVIPSGWEILNARMGATGIAANESAFDYRDVRDDRIHTYFGLKPGESKTFVQVFNVAYPGRYYLPAWNVEAMYDARRYARNVGRWVEVKKP